ncbi:MAG: PIN domain-containing protein [bacterium]|nr:PIN domain-containing protein [bacterium]
MFKRAILVDYENVCNEGLAYVDKLTEENKVVIFFSKNANHMTFQTHQKLMESRASIEYLEVTVGGRNALDIQLATYLGYLAGNQGAEEYFIISKDNGFKHVESFGIQKLKIQVSCKPYIGKHFVDEKIENTELTEETEEKKTEDIIQEKIEWRDTETSDMEEVERFETKLKREDTAEEWNSDWEGSAFESENELETESKKTVLDVKAEDNIKTENTVLEKEKKTEDALEVKLDNVVPKEEKNPETNMESVAFKEEKEAETKSENAALKEKKIAETQPEMVLLTVKNELENNAFDEEKPVEDTKMENVFPEERFNKKEYYFMSKTDERKQKDDGNSEDTAAETENVKEKVADREDGTLELAWKQEEENNKKIEELKEELGREYLDKEEPVVAVSQAAADLVLKEDTEKEPVFEPKKIEKAGGEKKQKQIAKSKSPERQNRKIKEGNKKDKNKKAVEKLVQSEAKRDTSAETANDITELDRNIEQRKGIELNQEAKQKLKEDKEANLITETKKNVEVKQNTPEIFIFNGTEFIKEKPQEMQKKSVSEMDVRQEEKQEEKPEIKQDIKQEAKQESKQKKKKNADAEKKEKKPKKVKQAEPVVVDEAALEKAIQEAYETYRDKKLKTEVMMSFIKTGQKKALYNMLRGKLGQTDGQKVYNDLKQYMGETV